MSSIYPGRFTAVTDEPFVVFLIGMRFNKLKAVRKWWPVFTAMPKMLTSLMQDPELGFLGGSTLLGWRSVTIIQYWRSFEALEQFARNPAEAHLGAWKQFNQAIGSDGSVGIWHETYLIDPGKFENVYGNMPRVGLGAAVEHVPVTGGMQTARRRMAHAPATEAAP